MTNLKSLDMDYFKKIAERVKNEKDNPKVEPTPAVPVAPKITQSKKDYWIIPDVNYNGIRGNVDVSKNLLLNGMSKDQFEWSNYSNIAKQNGDFYTPDYPLLYNTLERAFDLKDSSSYQSEIEEMRKSIQAISRFEWLSTLTKVTYNARDVMDELTHNVGLKNEDKVFLDLGRGNGEIPGSSAAYVYNKLLGTKSSVSAIRNVFCWLNDSDSVYIRRLISRPNSHSHVLAGFKCDFDKVNLGCDRAMDYSFPSLGMRFVDKV